MASKKENCNQTEFDYKKASFHKNQIEKDSPSTDEQLDVLATIIADLLLKEITEDHDKQIFK